MGGFMPEALSNPPQSPTRPSWTLDPAFARMEAHPRWQRLGWLYLVMGLVSAAFAAGPTSAQEIGLIPIAIAWAVSVNVVWPVMWILPRQPMFLLLLAWVALILWGLTWTTDPRQGQWDYASMRFCTPIVVMSPLLRDRGKLIAALAVGFVLGNASQFVLWASHTMAHDFKPWVGRNPGWWTHPAEAGYILVAALGLHLPAAFMGRGRTRLLAIGGCLVTWLGMLATGTRGAWIAGAGLMVFGVVVAVVGGFWKWRAVRWGLLAVVVAAAIGWATLGDFVSRRVHDGAADVRAALVEHRYQSDTGGRIKLALMAIDMFKQRPLLGWGPGSYRKYADARLRAEGATEEDMQWWADRTASAHNAWLNIAATLGLVGLVLAAAIVVVTLRGGFENLQGRLGTYAAGPAFALVGMLLTTPFDVTYVNSVPSAVLGVLMVLCLMHRPRDKT
jgi:O-antigen ligase